MQSANRQQSCDLLEDNYPSNGRQKGINSVEKKQLNSMEKIRSKQESQERAYADIQSPNGGDQIVNDYTDYGQQLHQFSQYHPESEQRVKQKGDANDLSMSSKKKMKSVDRRNLRQEDANQIIEQSRKYLQERRTKRNSVTDDGNVQENSSALEESVHDPPSQLMNTIDKRDAVDGLESQYNPTKDEGQKASIQRNKQFDIDLDDLEGQLNADLGDGSSSIDGALIQSQPVDASESRLPASEIPSKVFGKRGHMEFGTDTSYLNDENELLIRDEASKNVPDSSAQYSATLSQRALDRMIYQDGNGDKLRNTVTHQITDNPSTDRGPVQRTEESFNHSVNESAHNIFGRSVPENMPDDFSSLNTNLQNEENERQLQKYEADIRQHISIEQQLQIYIDSLKQKIEDMEKDQIRIEAQNVELYAENEKQEKVKAQQLEQIKVEYDQKIKIQIGEIDNLQNDNQKLKKQVSQKDNEISELKSTNNKHEERFKKTQVQLKQFQTEKERLGIENAHLKTEKNKLKQDLLKSQETIANMKKNVESNNPRQRRLSMQSQQPIGKDQQQNIQPIQQTTVQPNINSSRIHTRQMPNSKKEQLIGPQIRELEINGRKVGSNKAQKKDLDTQMKQKNTVIDNKQLEQVIAMQAAVLASQNGGSPFLGSDSEIKSKMAPKSQRASKSIKNMFLQDAQLMRQTNQRSERNISADRIKMIDSMTLEGRQQQLLINQSQMIGMNGRSQPQLIIQDSFHIENGRASNASIKKRIPLKKGSGPGGLGSTKANNHSAAEISQGGTNNRKHSVKKHPTDNLTGSYMVSTGMNQKQNIESTFSYNMNKPNLQKYLKGNKSMSILRDQKKRVQSVTVVPTRNTTLNKPENKPQKNQVNQRASSINSNLVSQAQRTFQPLRANESIQKHRKKNPQMSHSKSPDYGNIMRHNNQWIGADGGTIAQQSSGHFMNPPEVTRQRSSSSNRQGPFANKSSVGSEMHAQSPTKDAQIIRATANNVVPDEGGINLSNRNGGVDSRGSYSGQHFLYTGGGTGEPISSFQNQQMISGNNSIHQTRANQGEAGTSQGQDVLGGVDLQKSNKHNTAGYKPSAVSSQQNLNQFIQMNILQLQQSGINLGPNDIQVLDDKTQRNQLNSDQVLTRAQSSSNSQLRLKNRLSDNVKSKQTGQQIEAHTKNKAPETSRRNNNGVQSSARMGRQERMKNASTSVNSTSKINSNLRQSQNMKTISREGVVTSMGLQKSTGATMSHTNLNTQSNMKLQSTQIQRHGDLRLGARLGSNMSQLDLMVMNQNNMWEEHQLIQPEDVEFNGPGTRLEFLEVDNNSQIDENLLNRPLSQVDVRELNQGIIEAETGQNVNTAHQKVQSQPNTNTLSKIDKKQSIRDKIRNTHRASQEGPNTVNRRNYVKHSYNNSITSMQSIMGTQSMQHFKQTGANSNGGMVLVDSKNIPYGEIITVPASQAKDIAASAAGTDSRNISNWQQLRQSGARGVGQSKSVIQTKFGNSGGKSLMNRNLNAKPTQDQQSRTKNLVQNFVSKTYGQTAQGAQQQVQRKANGATNRAMPNVISHAKGKSNQVPAVVRSLHIDLSTIEDKTILNQQQQQQQQQHKRTERA